MPIGRNFARFDFRIIIASIFLIASSPRLHAQRPRLIVQITMDQLRGDLVQRYAPVLDRGFRRMEDGGYWIRKGDVDHALTLSFPGHASLVTGMLPSHHGLTANEWWLESNGTWKEVDVTDDAGVHILGSPATRVGASPKFLLATTLGEWIKKADPQAKSIAVGTGTNIPIAYAGHLSDGAFWFDSSLNQFTTSTFYAENLPGWITSFNQEVLPKFERSSWKLSVPSKYMALADSKKRSFNHSNGIRAFPHVYANESTGTQGTPVTLSRWFAGTPMKDEALFALAARAVDAERLGQRGSTDYLAIDVDSTDSVGHEYGPRSLEQLDTLFRMDRALGDFLQHLDQMVGKGNYLVALSADHGVSDSPGVYPGGRRVTMPEIEALLDRVEKVATAEGKSEREITKAIVMELKASSFIADAYTEDDLARPSKDPYVHLYAHGFRQGFTTNFPLWTDKRRDYHPARYGIVVRFKKGMVLDAAIGVHGSPYEYDRDVPIIFFGAGIQHGVRPKGARTVDVAPTLGTAAGIAIPADLDGRPLAFVLSSAARGSNRK